MSLKVKLRAEREAARTPLRTSGTALVAPSSLIPQVFASVAVNDARAVNLAVSPCAQHEPASYSRILQITHNSLRMHTSRGFTAFDGLVNAALQRDVGFNAN